MKPVGTLSTPLTILLVKLILKYLRGFTLLVSYHSQML
jgi:hypothetical protein